MTEHQSDPLRERFRLRSAVQGMKAKQRLAGFGAIIGFLIIAVWHRFSQYASSDLQPFVFGAALVMPVLFSIPFLRSKCPSCRGTFHGLGSIFRNQDNPLPCKSCGFKIDGHLSRYT